MSRLAAAAALVCALLLAVPALAQGANGPKDNDTYVQLLAINDFHGHVESTTPGTIRNSNNVVVQAGGSEYLATWINRLRERNSNTLFVGSGDLVGASPLTSALFHDELLLEAPENEVSAVKDLVRDEMCRAYDLDPPLAVDIGVGDDWNEAKS